MPIVVGFGGNLHFGDMSPDLTIKSAIGRLSSSGVVVTGVSRLYQTAALPYKDQPDFVNAAAMINTDLEPDSLLELLHDIEAQFGRKRTDRWQARTLDIDILVYDDIILPNLDQWWGIVRGADPAAFITSPMIPHPRLHVRAFALKPLLDVLPDYIHPILKQSGMDLLAGLCDQDIALFKKTSMNL